MVWGFPYEAPFPVRWDPRRDFKRKDEVDLDWVGEDSDGIWLRYHPETAISMLPEDIAMILVQWRYGLREITPKDHETMTARELDAKVTLAVAHDRERQRRFNDKSRKGPHGN